MSEAVPAFLTIAVMPLTYSIAYGASTIFCRMLLQTSYTSACVVICSLPSMCAACDPVLPPQCLFPTLSAVTALQPRERPALDGATYSLHNLHALA